MIFPFDGRLAEEHILHLGVCHCIGFERAYSPRGCYGNTGARVVGIPRTDREVGYAVALHEIGHVVLKHRASWFDSIQRVQSEAEAWEWARAEAHWWMPAMQEVAAVAFSTYLTTGWLSPKALRPYVARVEGAKICASFYDQDYFSDRLETLLDPHCYRC